MPIALTTFLLPKNGNTFFLLEDVYLKGGFRVVADIAARDALNPINCKAGMLLRTADDGKFYTFTGDETNKWKPFSAEGNYLIVDAVEDRDLLVDVPTGTLVYVKADDKVWKRTASETEPWLEFKTGSGSKERVPQTIPNIEIAAMSYTDVDIDLGSTVALLLQLGVDVPCLVEIHSVADRSDFNPYKFLGKDTHLTDDGSTEMSDGTIVYGRRYSILANLETPAVPTAYARIYNASDSPIVVNLSLDLLPQ